MTVHSMATLRSYRTNNEKRLERITERLRGFYAKNATVMLLPLTLSRAIAVQALKAQLGI